MPRYWIRWSLKQLEGCEPYQAKDSTAAVELFEKDKNLLLKQLHSQLEFHVEDIEEG